MNPFPHVDQPARTRGTPVERSDQGPGERSDDCSLGTLRAACHASGGIARRNDLARWMEGLHCGDLVSLTQGIAMGEVLGFDWRHTAWVPMFQFDPVSLALRPEPRQVLAALAGAFDGWSLACWFTQPNTWLLDCRPVDLLHSDLPAVLKAARKDRFIAEG
jgi:hypothetical protein